MRVQDIIQKSDVFLYQFMKMTANIGNQQILNENLSTFQLFYQISPLETKIVIKTYSYNFPIVTNDILDSSFEIVREFVIQRNNLKSWHYLQLELQDNKFNIKITFYDNEKVIQFYETQVDVKQFHNCQFKLRYGNILQNSQNYLNVEIKQLYYLNCRQDDIIIKCHYSCLDCNGPNISNCLSCSVESNRIYISQFNHCICPQSSIDYQQRCMNNEDLNLQIIEKQNIYLKCQIGYFELEGECKRCPSRISDNLITCYDCFANQEWSLDSFCYTDYYTPISFELSSTFIFTPIIFFNYDGSDFVFCDFCEQVFDQKYDLQNQINLYELFLFKSQRFLQFCFTLDKNDDEGKHCYLCTVINCILCQIAIDQQLCVICREGFKQINGLCMNLQNFYFIYIYNNNQITYQSCQPPYYTSFMKQCTLCSIQYCLYCFQYFNDSLVSTFDGLDFALEGIIKIGCVQCQDGYTFDFTLELCLKQVPKIQNCLTSYVMQFKEVCIVSSLENFQVSPIINKCDNFIINCLKCALDNNKIIFCIECIDGFMLQNGQCYMNQEFGSNYEISNWNQKIKAFLLIYRKTNIPDDNNQNIELSFQCGRSCLKCNISDKQYICDQCNLDYFDDQIRIQHGLYCPECPQLCQVCETRSFADIKSFNPLFSITKENSIFTQKCLLPKFDPFIFYDPYLKTTQYCLDGDCNNGLEFEYWQYDCFLERLPKNLSDFGINTEYCNQVGLKTLTFSLYFEIDSDFCHYNLPLITKATLKVEVFTLKTVNLRLKSVNQFPFIVSNSLEFYEYDTISMINTEFIFLEYLQNYILFSNQQNQIDVILVNFTIKDSSIVDITSLFYAEQFGSIYIQNFSIINTTIRNSSLFNLQLLKFEGQMTISSLFIVNCTFIDAQLFQFSKSLKNIQIVNLTLDTCTLQNASLYTLFLNYIKESTIQLKNLIIQRNNFQNSNFFFCSQLIKIDLIDVILNSNHFDNSIIFGFSYSLSTSNIQITDNIFIESSFLQTIQVTNDLYTRCSMSKLLIYKNVLQNTNLFNIFSNSYSNNLQIDITRVHIELNIRSITLKSNSIIIFI